MKKALMALSLCSLLLAGCPGMREGLNYNNYTLQLERGGYDPVRIAQLFDMAPGAKAPAKLAVVEEGTDSWTRLMSLDHPGAAAGDGENGGADPLLSDRAVLVEWTPMSDYVPSSGPVDALLPPAAQLQHDVVLLVKYRWRAEVGSTVLTPIYATGLGLILPATRVEVDVLAQGLLVDVRTRLILGIVETRLSSGGSYCNAFGVDSRIEDLREELHPRLYRSLSERVQERLQVRLVGPTPVAEAD